MTAVRAMPTPPSTERPTGSPVDARTTPRQPPIRTFTDRGRDVARGPQPESRAPLGTDVPSASASATSCWVRPAPERQPAFDDQPPARHLHLVYAAAAPQLPFPTPVAQPSPGPRGPGQPPRRRLAVVPCPDDTRVDLVAPLASGEPGAARTRHRPDPTRFGRQFAQGLVEVLSGRRPTVQLIRHVSPGVQRGLTRAGGSQPLLSPTAPVLHSLRLSEPAAGVCEMSAVVVVGARYRALAARLEWNIDHWRCTALQVG